MRRLSGMLVLVAFLLLLAAGPVVAQSDSDAEAIQGVLNAYVRAWNAGDVASWIAVWDEDGIHATPDTEPVLGRESIRMAVRPLIENFVNDLSINVEEVKASGHVGYVRGTYLWRGVTKAALADPSPLWKPKPIPARLVSGGAFLSICQQQPDGSWKLYHTVYVSGAQPR